MSTTSALPMPGLPTAHAASILSPNDGPLFQGAAVAKKPTDKRVLGSSSQPVPTQPNAITIRGMESVARGVRRKDAIQANGDH